MTKNCGIYKILSTRMGINCFLNSLKFFKINIKSNTKESGLEKIVMIYIKKINIFCRLNILVKLKSKNIVISRE